MVVAGKEKGKTGKVLKILPKKDRAVVEKVNFIKRHMRPGAHSRQGGIVEKENPIQVSPISCWSVASALIPRRVGRRVLEDGKQSSLLQEMRRNL